MSTLGARGRRTFLIWFFVIAAISLWSVSRPVLLTILNYQVLNFMAVQSIMGITAFVLFVWTWKNWA